MTASNYSKSNPTPSNFSKSNLNASNHTKSNPVAGNYGLVDNVGDPSFLLLQTGDYLLLQDGASKIILENGPTNKANFSKTNPSPTSYTTV